MGFSGRRRSTIENELDRIDRLYALRVRQLGVTYSESNDLCNGLKEDTNGGLAFGKLAVDRMYEACMIIDVSHCGPTKALDVVNWSSKTSIASHVGARALWDSIRLFHDDLIITIVSKGVVIAIESASHTTQRQI